MSHSLTNSLTPVIGKPSRTARLTLALILRAASFTLNRLARAIAPAAPKDHDINAHYVEFYADPGADGGLVYADGKLVGRLPNIKRL
ncbi:hypothetical protein [Rhodoferax aquaticus]|uniref:Uncharacterized protein n=1 Tax=Rhodoferax aquaticus TaxID=2527691 RepID=A0A515ERA7_9BURK|nr:hypothetical protein [Rhodoferax aquaticus]QDL55202.1 hypothetical protein EXZ61_14070 [Rhodoferax aquaticus]